ncbi:unnamed protein product [Blepharisma stoltei]|uniref:Purple acid phosphatase n=1 Tax=Blepharisma stoltei TaxID=1481888 RepID=A0AAU9JY11_9CILI|nr:unnamed protein product [Blepharisma stoltei]
MQKKIAIVVGVFFIGILNIFWLAYDGDVQNIPIVLHRVQKVSQVHIALGKEENSIQVMWTLKEDGKDCWIDMDGKKISNYQKDILEYLGNTGKPYKRFLYSSLLNSLEPATIYSYKISCIVSNITISSQKFSFRSPPSQNSTITAISFADFQTNYYPDPKDKYSKTKKANILPHLYQISKSLDNYDIILHAGDIAYDLWSYNGLMADHFMESIEHLSSRFPYMTVPGSHESFTNFTHYKKLFQPQNSLGLFYSFNLGYAHFIMLDSESFVGRLHTEEMIENHMKFLKEDLETNIQPWTIVISHRPIYCNPNPLCKVCTTACTQYSSILSGYLEDLLFQYNATLWISGNVHLYERSMPVYKNEIMQFGINKFENPPAPIYIVNGVAGNFDTEDDLSSVGDEKMPWNVVASESLGYGKLVVHNKTHLEWIQYAIGKTQQDSPDMIETARTRIIDEFFIIKTDN